MNLLFRYRLALFLLPLLFLGWTNGCLAETPYEVDQVEGVKGSQVGKASAITLPTGTGTATVGIGVRVAAYNIAHGRGFKVGGLDEIGKTKNLDGIAALLKKEKIDVVGFTEIAGGHSIRVLFHDQPKYMGKKLDMKYVYGENVRRGLFGLGATQGNAIMSRFPILSSKNHNLYRSKATNEQRACLEALLDLGNGQKLRVFCAHLATNKEESSKQVEELWAMIEKSDDPVILLGDFNLRPTSEPIKWLCERMKDTTANLKSSHTSVEAGIKIDYHFTKGPITGGMSYMRGFEEAYSDHGCVINQYVISK